MSIKGFLRDTTEKYDGIDMLKIRPHVICKDGFTMSVQASRHHYCDPRIDLEGGNYNEVEIGFPSEEESLIMEYAECPSEPTGSVYGYVPIEIVDAVIEKHGGIVTT